VIALMLACAALLLLALAALTLPLLRRARALPERGQFDRAVYRDQLAELDNDVARGVLSPSEAGPARLEIQRRLLAVQAGKSGGERAASRSPRLTVAVAVLVSAGAGGLYWQLGAPSLPDTPFSIQPAKADEASPHAGPGGHGDFRAAAEKLQKKLAADPNNAEGWELYGHTLSRLGDWQRAADAYRRALDLGRNNAAVYSGYGEMLVLGAQGIVLPPAREAFGSALKVAPGDEVSRFYLALADAQAGEARKAVDEWLQLAANLTDDDPMRDELTNRIAEAARSGGFEAPPLPKGQEPPAAQAGPSSQQIEAAANMSPADRDKMIRGMIDQLAEKLKANPNDVEGWLRLANAYGVQGDNDKAADAYEHAAQLKPNDPTIKLEAVATMIARLQPSDAIPQRAIVLLHEVSAVAPAAPEVLWYLGVVAAREGRPDEAKQNWTRLLASLDSAGEDYKMVQSALGSLDGPAKK
jgi:cytochrome c-type biogenesis protein CcmH